jgi:hypothetical protein
VTRRRDWVFRHACGCPFGVLVAERGGAGRVLTRSEAWKDFYATARERDEAMDRGVTAELMDHERYSAEVYPQMRSEYRCPHGVVTQ